ncbi:MAG: type VI secretion protein [Ruminococcus sp.]|nr:type VI secretion protein [Ruminococcus sp.]
MEQKELMQRMQQSAFARNNAMALKAINLLRDKYVALEDICNALQPSMTEPEFRDAVNYLTECGYIRLRDTETKSVTTLADAPMNALEAKVTADGIRIIACTRTDECIDV